MCYNVKKMCRKSSVGRGVICEVTPIGLLTYFVKVFLSQSAQSSRSFLAHSFEPTEGLRHTEFTERYFQRWVLDVEC